MTPAGIATTLKGIRLDKDVRDFLVAAVTQQHERSRNDLFRKHGRPSIT